MSEGCPQCGAPEISWTKFGYFVRDSDKKHIQKFKCKKCQAVFSRATFQSCYRQKKRKLNPRILELHCSGVSQRRIAKLLKITRKTVYKKFIFLAKNAKDFNLKKFNQSPKVSHFQFDDLETIEHTKCKPLSVTMAIEESSRKILAFKVSQMPAKGHLAKIALKKYGPRADFRSLGRKEVFEKLLPKVYPEALIESDQNTHYFDDVKKYFPRAKHVAFLSKRGAIAGQGELKKVVFDPLFTLNHTFAMLRANINRLFRKTWCTTKLPERLADHIELYVYYHNEVLLKVA
jgi:transposase-like protein